MLTSYWFLGWNINPAHVAWLSPTTSRYSFGLVLARFYFWADLDPVSFWVGSGPSRKKYFFVFMHTTKSLEAKKIILYFYTTKNVLACILALITSLLKALRTRPIFYKKSKKYFVCFSIRDFEFIHKTYSRY